MTAARVAAASPRSRRRCLLVLLSAELYLAATLGGYFWGPLRLEDEQPVQLAVLVLAYQAALAVGFLASRVPSRPPAVPLDHSQQRWLVRGVVAGTCLSIAFGWWSIGASAGGWAPWTVARALVTAVADPGAAYLANYRGSGTEGSPLPELMSLCAPLTFGAAVLGLALWRRLGNPVRVLVVADLLLQVATGMVRGQNLAVFKVAVVLVALVLLRWLRDEPAHGRQRRSRRGVVSQLVVLGAAPVLYFALNTASRFSTARPEEIVDIPVDYGAPLMQGVPETLHLHAALLFTYLSQGYQGLSLALGMDFRSTWGAGSSVTLMDNFAAATGYDIRARTYVDRMDPVWEQSTNWHTAYTWFANDVSPYGVVLVMLLIGWFAGLVTHGALRGELLATVLLPLVLLQVLFLPANSLVLSNPLLLTPLAVWGTLFVLAQFAPRLAWLNCRARTSEEGYDGPDGRRCDGPVRAL